ncbi:MAG: hypothetical protein LWW85_11625 [Marinilabiliales bacterium]|nr:hypothetical protein [Marinilabiliales bacterium]
MTCIHFGALSDFVPENHAARPTLPPERAIMSAASPDQSAVPFHPFVSEDPRGLALKSILLEENFDGFFKRSGSVNQLYFIAWAWDLSGRPVSFYPGIGSEKGEFLIPVRVGHQREFLGEGINLFPKGPVTGGLALRIQIWESDGETRTLGEMITKIAQEVRKSRLSHLLSLISLTTGITGATLALLKDASIEVAGQVGSLLQENGDDFVDFFEGYFASDQPWRPGTERYEGVAARLTLHRY